MNLFDDSKQRADRLFQQGLELYKRQQFQEATEKFGQALALYQQLNDCLGIEGYS